MAKRGRQEFVKTTEASRKKVQEIIRSKIIKRRVSKNYLYTYVHSSIIRNSQKVEATQISNEWINKNLVYTYNRMLLSLKKEGDSDTWYNMVEP